MLPKREFQGFGIDCSKHIGPIWFWRNYCNIGKPLHDKEEFGVGFGSDIYFYFGFAIYNGWIEFTFRISGIGKLTNRTSPNTACTRLETGDAKSESESNPAVPSG